MITDPWFYLAAIPAVLIFGISKGGFGGGFGMVAVPIMSLVISPVQAAAILLPILCLMDLAGLRAFWGLWEWSELRGLLPASLVGIGIGTTLYGYMSPGIIRLIVGLVAIVFTLHFWIGRIRMRQSDPANWPQTLAAIGGATAGFTSFVAHAGGPPLNMYLLRRPLDRTTFVATSVMFFAVVNYLKLVPYAWLGQLAPGNLATSAVLAPLAPIGVGVGVWLHRRVSDRLFFSAVYVLLFFVGCKLIYDGLGGLR